MDDAKKQLLNHQLSQLRVQLLFAKLSVCSPDWIRHRFTPSYNKVYLIKGGEGWLQIGKEQLCPEPGDLVFIPGGVEQSYSVTGGTPYTMHWCHFKTNLNFNRLFQLFGLTNVVKADESRELQHWFRELEEHRRDEGPATSLKIQSALFAIISYFIDHAVTDHGREAVNDSLRKLTDTIHYIDDHLSRELTIEELAQNAHFHPNYFIRVFKRHLGMPPMRYIHERRMEKAKQLLSSTDLTVGEVARRTGFKDVSYFSAAFRKGAGASPSEYRNLFPGR
ncbi:AraC family transcriptional regulator [Paenibacillus sp. OAS669]|uniref:AraC family transcriptional regulator n=1 Tax=Paenibacillus sp. OAS669 TaxID=2663821 RepID=UPI001789798A|nr:AraC family transcriptional regulator [Paenibacillus sp. OAS669]MBE1445019.1 AraC-like DNA-binding protein [Paenibacillus sp. OAS669]